MHLCLLACSILTVPASAIISYLLLGVEDIGVQIEEPFSKLPLEEICSVSIRVQLGVDAW